VDCFGKLLSRTRMKLFGKTSFASELPGKTPRPTETGTRSMGTSPPSTAWWTAEGRDFDRARRALRLQRLKVSDREDPFAVIIRCTADPAKADKRTRSKWSRVLRYAAAYKPSSEPLDQFIKRKGGINKCAARFTRWLGRGAPRRTAS
jgi:hypothetical protein